MAVPNIDQSHTATTTGSKHSTATETERIEPRSPSSRNTQAPKRGEAPAQQDGVQPVGAAQRVLADQVAPEKSGARFRARASARRLPPRRHIRSISDVVTDQWVVTSP